MNELASKHCAPCSGSIPALTGPALEEFRRSAPSWHVIENHHIQKTFPLRDFATALDFVVRIGAVAEQEGHHPDLCLSWGSVAVTIYTHAIQGLSENDFILAAKIDHLFEA